MIFSCNFGRQREKNHLPHLNTIFSDVNTCTFCWKARETNLAEIPTPHIGKVPIMVVVSMRTSVPTNIQPEEESRKKRPSPSCQARPSRRPLRITTFFPGPTWSAARSDRNMRVSSFSRNLIRTQGKRVLHATSSLDQRFSNFCQLHRRKWSLRL